MYNIVLPSRERHGNLANNSIQYKLQPPPHPPLQYFWRLDKTIIGVQYCMSKKSCPFFVDTLLGEGGGVGDEKNSRFWKYSPNIGCMQMGQVGPPLYAILYIIGICIYIYRYIIIMCHIYLGN